MYDEYQKFKPVGSHSLYNTKKKPDPLNPQEQQFT